MIQSHIQEPCPQIINISYINVIITSVNTYFAAYLQQKERSIKESQSEVFRRLQETFNKLWKVLSQTSSGNNRSSRFYHTTSFEYSN